MSDSLFDDVKELLDKEKGDEIVGTKIEDPLGDSSIFICCISDCLFIRYQPR